MQTRLPLYCLSAALCLLACCTCGRSLTRWIRASAILEMTAAMPPARKSLEKEMPVPSWWPPAVGWGVEPEPELEPGMEM